MTILEAIIIAVVEGLTEFLPVSSTGHMIITQAVLGIESTPFVKAFTIIIQFGAILSVVVLYWKRFFRLNPIPVINQKVVAGMSPLQKGWTWLQRFLHQYDFYWKLFIAVIPAGIIGLLLGDQIDAMLENVLVVAVMLLAGGIFMLFVDQWFNKPSQDQSMNWQRAVKIGFFQCIAMIPGVSRSMATIVGGMGTKLNGAHHGCRGRIQAVSATERPCKCRHVERQSVIVIRRKYGCLYRRDPRHPVFYRFPDQIRIQSFWSL